MSGFARRIRWIPIALCLAALLGIAGLELRPAVWRILHSDSPVPAQVEPDAEQRQRGAYLARIGNCAHCHTARGGDAYAGGRTIQTPFGAVVSSNLTPDPQFGIGRWSADDFWQAMHLGRGVDGRLLVPAFPYTSTTRLSRADSDALWTYLRSLPTSPQPNASHQLRWPFGSQTALWVWQALYLRPGPAMEQAPAPEDPLRGAYLVEGLAHCQECHAARNLLGARQDDSLQGSVLGEGRWYAPSLRSGAQAGVGGWAEDEVLAFLTTGTSPRGVAQGPMAEVVLHGTQYLKTDDARAMARYLRQLDRAPEPASPAKPPAGSQAPTSADGATLYAHHCADCHGKQGQGVAGVYPALAGNRSLLHMPANNAIHVLLRGGFAPATAGNPRPYGMPPFLLTLDDRQAAAVLNYVRNAWGNQAPPVGEFDINAMRR